MLGPLVHEGSGARKHCHVALKILKMLRAFGQPIHHMWQHHATMLQDVGLKCSLRTQTYFRRCGRHCGPVVRALALRSGDPGFKTRSNHSLNLILVVPGSTSQLHL